MESVRLFLTLWLKMIVSPRKAPAIIAEKRPIVHALVTEVLGPRGAW